VEDVHTVTGKPVFHGKSFEGVPVKSSRAAAKEAEPEISPLVLRDVDHLRLRQSTLKREGLKVALLGVRGSRREHRCRSEEARQEKKAGKKEMSGRCGQGPIRSGAGLVWVYTSLRLGKHCTEVFWMS
jgi:hypothetical protein